MLDYGKRSLTDRESMPDDMPACHLYSTNLLSAILFVGHPFRAKQ